MHVVSGQDFDPQLNKISMPVPSNKNYTMFLFSPIGSRSLHLNRLYRCENASSCGELSCGAMFSDISKCYDHLRSHSHERQLICYFEGCGKTFTQRGNLRRHINTHLGVKKFGCSRCGRRFGNSFNLERHAKYCPKKEDKNRDIDLVGQ